MFNILKGNKAMVGNQKGKFRREILRRQNGNSKNNSTVIEM